MTRFLFVVLSIMSVSFNISAQEVSFVTEDRATIYADFDKRGSHAVLLAHGAIFNKGSWVRLQQSLLELNYSVLAIDFRGYGKSTVGSH